MARETELTFSRREGATAIATSGREKREVMRPRMTWRQRVRRLWGFIKRRRSVAKEDLQEMHDSDHYWGERHNYIFGRLHYFEAEPGLEKKDKIELDSEFAKDLSALASHDKGHFEQRLKQFDYRDSNGRRVREAYRLLSNALNPALGNPFKTAFQADINQPRSEIINSIVKSGFTLARWLRFRRTTEKVMDHHAPAVGEALIHVYDQNAAANALLRKLRNIYTLRAALLKHPIAPPVPRGGVAAGGGGIP